MSTCPWNPAAKNPNPDKHPLAAASAASAAAPVKKLKLKKLAGAPPAAAPLAAAPVTDLPGLSLYVEYLDYPSLMNMLQVSREMRASAQAYLHHMYVSVKHLLPERLQSLPERETIELLYHINKYKPLSVPAAQHIAKNYGEMSKNEIIEYEDEIDNPEDVGRVTIAGQDWYLSSAHAALSPTRHHRIYGPAHREWRNGVLIRSDWYRNGQYHRRGDLPALNHYFSSGELQLQQWYDCGSQHREGDQPANIQYRKNGKIIAHEWWRFGQLHRSHDKPARVRYYRSGQPHSEEWYMKWQRHRGSGPAHIIYYKSGKPYEMWWFQNDKLHNMSGPAHIVFKESGGIQYQEWYQDDKKTLTEGVNFKRHPDAANPVEYSSEEDEGDDEGDNEGNNEGEGDAGEN